MISRKTPHVEDLSANPFKEDFPLLSSNPQLAFLDSAATAQRPRSVIEAQAEFYRTTNANALRGLYGLSMRATAAIADARSAIARAIGADDPCEVIACRNASEALNMAATAFAGSILREGDEVCITVMEHHSNLIPWQQVCKASGARLVYLYPDEQGVITPDEMDAKIGPRTRIVAAAHVSNVLGIENPIAELARRVHERGGYLVVDGAQSVPHMRIDVAALDCDFFAFSAHKAFGPFGIGILWGRRALLEAMPPFLTGGEMISRVTQESASWAPIPEKFEAGTQDAAGLVATAVGLRYMEEIGMEAIRRRERALMRACTDALFALPFIEPVGDVDPERRHGVVAFNVAGIHPHDVASILDSCDVAIRAGHHCAQPLLAWMGVESCCRASLAFYNDERDIAALVDGLNTVWRTFHG
ncbi:MAG: SufS family cysteine desulfurase [Slackia sp.]|nr:SufS family cysteine desulfurase [Slackia sp.]